MAESKHWVDDLKFSSRQEIETELVRNLKDSFHERSAEVPDDLKFLQSGQERFECQQIGEDEGMVNYIFRIREKSAAASGAQHSVVIKWSRLIPRVANEHKMGLERLKDTDFAPHDVLQRNTEEAKSLKVADGIVPGCTPTVLWVDPKRYFFVMEDLRDYINLNKQLSNNEVVPEVFEKINHILVSLHKKTHVKTVGEEKFKSFKETLFVNSMLAGVAEEMFTNSFQSKNVTMREFSEPVKKVLPEIMDNAEIVKVMARLRDSFLNIHLCYLQNDSHPGAFMVNKEKNVRMLDLEFAFMGNPAKEVGYFLGEIVLFYYIFIGRGRRDVAERLRGVVSTFIATYLEEMGECIVDHAQFMRYLAGHAAHFAGFRTLGIVPFPQFCGLEREEAAAVRAITRLLKGMGEITTIDGFLKQAFGSN